VRINIFIIISPADQINTATKEESKIMLLATSKGAFRVDQRTYFTKCNEMERPWKIIIFLTHLFNSFQAIVPYMGQEKGSIFNGGVSPSKIGLIAPY
jgi:hypothetical protein